MHGVLYSMLSTARQYASKKEGGSGRHSIENVVCQKKQSLKFYVRRKAESGPLMKERKHLIAT